LLLQARHPPCATSFPYTTLFRSRLRRSWPRRGHAILKAEEPSSRSGARARGSRSSLFVSSKPRSPPSVSARESDRSTSRRTVRRSEEHTSELQSPDHLVCRLLLE